MKFKTLVSVVVSFGFAFCVSCKSSDEGSSEGGSSSESSPANFMEKSLSLTEEYAGIMESIKDVDSGKAAIEKMDGLIGKYEELGKMAKDAQKGDAAPEAAAKMAQEMQSKMAPIQERLQKAMMPAMQVLATNPELMKSFQDKSQELSQKMMAAMK